MWSHLSFFELPWLHPLARTLLSTSLRQVPCAYCTKSISLLHCAKKLCVRLVINSLFCLDGSWDVFTFYPATGRKQAQICHYPFCRWVDSNVLRDPSKEIWPNNTGTSIRTLCNLDSILQAIVANRLFDGVHCESGCDFQFLETVHRIWYIQCIEDLT